MIDIPKFYFISGDIAAISLLLEVFMQFTDVYKRVLVLHLLMVRVKYCPSWDMC